MYRPHVHFSPVRKHSFDPRPLLQNFCTLISLAAALTAAFFLIHGAFTQPPALIADPGTDVQLPERVTMDPAAALDLPKERKFNIYTRGRDRKAFDRFLHGHITDHGGRYLHHAKLTGKTRHYSVPTAYLPLIEPLHGVSELNVLNDAENTAYRNWHRVAADADAKRFAGPHAAISVRVVQPAFEKRRTIILAGPLAFTAALLFTTAHIIGFDIYQRRQDERRNVRDAERDYNQNRRDIPEDDYEFI